jgi:hypothetical protein
VLNGVTCHDPQDGNDGPDHSACWGSTVGTIVGGVLLVVAAIMLVTAAVGYCPTYRLLNISTNPTFHRTSKPEAKVLVHH